MDLTLFDLLLIIKDTEKPIILARGDVMQKYRFSELALDNDLLPLDVAGVRCDTFNGRPSYIVKIRGVNNGTT